MPSSDIITLIVRSEVEKALADLNKVNNATSKIKANSDGLSKSFSMLKTSFFAIAGTALAVGAAINKSVQAASNLNEAINYWEVTFAGAAGTASKYIEELANNYAMSHREAYQLTAELGSLLKPMGMTTIEAAKMSGEMVKLAADLGSIKNVRTEDALNAIRSGLSGETEPMKRFGVDLRETALAAEALSMGLHNGKGALSAKAKAMAAYQIILRATKDAQGDMIRTGDSWANQIKKLKANSEEFAASMGAKIIPALKLFVKDLNEAAGGDVGEAIGEVIGKFLLIVKYAYHAKELIFSSIDASVGKISTGIAEVGVKFGELIDSDEITNFFKDQLRTSENYQYAAEKNLDKHYKKIDEINKTWGEISKSATKKQYADDASGLKNNLMAKQQMTQQQLDALFQQRQSYLKYTNQEITASLELEEKEYKKHLQFVGKNAKDRENIEKAHSANMKKIIANTIEDRVKRGADEMQKVIGIQQTLMNGIFNVQNQIAKNNQIRLDEQNRFFEMQLENQKKAFEEQYNDRYSQLEYEKAQEADNIRRSISDETLRNEALEALDKKYNERKQAIDNERAAAEKKMLEEQQAMKEQMDMRNMYLKHKEGVRQKEMAFAQALISAFLASAQAFSSCMWLPFPANLIVGGIVATGVLATGLLLANAIRNQPVPWLEEGGLIKGSQEGTLVRVAEKGKSEAVIPLQNAGVMEQLRGESYVIININAQTINGTEEVGRNFAIAIDKALYKLKKDKQSYSFG